MAFVFEIMTFVTNFIILHLKKNSILIRLGNGSQGPQGIIGGPMSAVNIL